jgi:hypothetical protein
MAKDKLVIPAQLQAWIEARQRFRLSHAHIQMARELGLNPKKLGKLDNHRQEPWKAPLPDFIAHLYLKSHGRPRPDKVRSIEEIAAEQRLKKNLKKAARRDRGGDLPTEPDSGES